MPENEALVNVYILYQILNYLPPRDLINCRLVHPGWLQEATTILKKRDYLQPIQIFTPDSSSFSFTCQVKVWSRYHVVRKQASLSKFIKLLEKTQSFPFNNFTVPSHVFQKKRIQQLFTFYGSYITSLLLDIDVEIETQESLLEVILDTLVSKLTNLKRLSLEVQEYCHEREYASKTGPPSSSPSLLLPGPGKQVLSLKSLTLRTDRIPPRALIWTLNCAPNLEEIRILVSSTLSDEYLVLLLEQEKAHLLKDMFYDFTNPSMIELYHHLGTQNLPPHLDTIHKIWFQPSAAGLPDDIELQIASILNKAFEQNADNLKIIRNCCPLGSLPGLIFPRFSKLTELEFCYHMSESDGLVPFQLFPRSQAELEVDLGGILPNLKSIKFDFDNSVFHCPPKQIFFNHVTRVPSVTHLSFSTDFFIILLSPQWLHYLVEMFPNVHSLKLPKFNLAKFPLACQNVWRLAWPTLKELEVTVLVDKYILNSELDIGFTGFSQDNLEVVIAQTMDFEASSVEYLRDCPSILKLKHLRTLRINVDFPECLIEAMNILLSGTLISEISSIHAFEVFPEMLELIVAIDFPYLIKDLVLILPTAKFTPYKNCAPVLKKPSKGHRRFWACFPVCSLIACPLCCLFWAP